MDLSQVAEIELIYKRRHNRENTPKVAKSKEAYNIFINHWNENKIDFLEEAKVILLSRSNRVLGISDISSVGIDSTIIDTRLVLVTALKANASGIILAHNHPSGNLQPSQLDRILTNRITNAGEMLGIEVFDHLIVASEGFYSFTEDLTYLSRNYNSQIIFEPQCPF